VKRQEAFATTSAFQTIDTKATGLLTYVAMMIAGLGLVAPLVADNDIEIGIIIAEMTAYLLIAIGCLRCLSIFAGRDMTGPDVELRLTRELLVRRELLALCNRASIILTAVVFVLLPFQFFYAPAK
jgi:predicted lysophospholipase L1 biosynthesis ABC-type transport system permease subunit